MPETPAPQTPAPQTPDLHSQIVEAVADLPETNSAPDTDTASAETTHVETPAAGTTTPPPTADEFDEFLKAEGIESPKPGQRENRVPYSRVKAITENARKKALAEQETALKGHTEKISGYEKRLSDIAQTEQVMLNDPQRFLQALQTIPAYRELLGGQAQQAGQAGQAQQAQAMPPPYLQLSDGSTTYSTAGLQKLMQWQTQQVEQKVSARYAPMEQNFAAQQLLAETVPKIRQQVAEARTWPLFGEHEAAILKALTTTPGGLSLDAAYRQVVFPKLQASRDTMRAEVLAELNAQPKSTSLATTGRADESVSDLPLHEQIRAALK